MHVYIEKGKTGKNATKVWLTASGGCILANNNGHIPQNVLGDLLDIIAAQFFMICNIWKEHFCINEIRFYC
ncbi:DUF4160 domain-containing protein [Christensenella hongkongensis]|uniref:DUF4160 domain-containing protein n=1 Tax=Christensenella hongkongensis TaxID=270498 RepID=UPI0038B3DF4C